MSDGTLSKQQSPPDEQVRRIARALKARHGAIDPSALTADEAFLDAARILEGDDVSDELVAQLARDSAPFVAAIGCEGIRLRGAAPPGWEKKALRRLAQAGSEEAFFHLRALAAAARRNVIPAVLGAANDAWLDGPTVDAARDFLGARVAAGERVHGNALSEHLAPEDVGIVSAILEGADDAVQEALQPAVTTWRRGLMDPEFFEQFARFVESSPAGLTTVVGTRVAVLGSLVGAIAARRPVLLVGEHGVGKSTLIREALRTLGADEWVAIEAGASDVMAGQTFIGELEGRVQEIAQRSAGQPLVWIFPRFEEAIWSGQHFRSPRGLFDALLPHLEAGHLLIVGELEPSAYEMATQLRPRIRSAFEIIRVAPLDEQDALEVCGRWVDRTGFEVSETTLREGYDLALHYLAGAAPPGGILRLLKATIDRHERLEGSREIGTQDLLETLSEASGLPLHVLDPGAPLDLDEVRSFFSNRVLGQPEAVQTLVERIAMIKAGLTDPTRPLGVFLFVGPTGTGKTEIAKALAEFLFGSPDKLVRLDMSEYQTPEAFDASSATPRAETRAARP